MGGVWSFLTKIREVVEVVAVVVGLRTPSAMSVVNLDILHGSVAVVESLGGVEALALVVVGVQIMAMHAGESSGFILYQTA